MYGLQEGLKTDPTHQNASDLQWCHEKTIFLQSRRLATAANKEPRRNFRYGAICLHHVMLSTSQPVPEA